MSDDFDYKAHERLRTRVANNMDSLLWTFKQHYKAGDIYGSLNQGADILSTVLAGLLTYGLIWNSYPTNWMIVIAIIIAVISGFKTAARPRKLSEGHFRAGAAYHRHFDQFRDFTTLDLANKDYGLERMREDFEELTAERRELNENQDDLSSLWYYWLKFSYKIRGGSPYDEIGTSKKAKARLTGKAKIPGSDSEGTDEEVKDELTGEAKLSKDEKYSERN